MCGSWLRNWPQEPTRTDAPQPPMRPPLLLPLCCLSWVRVRVGVSRGPAGTKTRFIVNRLLPNGSVSCGDNAPVSAFLFDMVAFPPPTSAAPAAPPLRPCALLPTAGCCSLPRASRLAPRFAARAASLCHPRRRACAFALAPCVFASGRWAVPCAPLRAAARLFSAIVCLSA